MASELDTFYEMVDEIAITGTAEECRDRLAAWDGILDHALFYPPSFGVRHERLLDNYALIRKVFGSGA